MEVPQMFLPARAVQMAAAATERANERPIVSRSVKGKWTESAETKGRRDVAEKEEKEEDGNLHAALNNDKRLTGDGTDEAQTMHDA